jgi:hypothetical protein
MTTAVKCSVTLSPAEVENLRQLLSLATASTDLLWRVCRGRPVQRELAFELHEAVISRLREAEGIFFQRGIGLLRLKDVDAGLSLLFYSRAKAPAGDPR